MGQELNGSLGSWVTLSDPFRALIATFSSVLFAKTRGQIFINMHSLWRKPRGGMKLHGIATVQCEVNKKSANGASRIKIWEIRQKVLWSKKLTLSFPKIGLALRNFFYDSVPQGSHAYKTVCI